MKSFITLLKNELKLNIRNMNMVIFAVIIPLVVLIILGFIYGSCNTNLLWNFYKMFQMRIIHNPYIFLEKVSSTLSTPLTSHS